MLRKARQAVIWSAADIFLCQGISFIISIVLARLLLPEDFGTIALLGLFFGLAGLFVNAGFSQALIQQQDVSQVDEASVFWFNNGIAFLIMLLLFALAPWIATFFALPILENVTIVLGLTIPISAFGGVHATLMTKRMDFKTPMKIGVTSAIVSGGIAMYIAWSGYGVWALAVQAVASSTLTTILFWVFSPWRPIYKFSLNSIKRLLNFGGWLFLGWLLDVIFSRGYTLLIGKLYSPFDLGIYNRADSTQQIPANLLSGILSKVTFPLYSSVNQERDQLRRGVRLSIRTMMFVTAPIMTGLAVVAEPFLRVVFGAQWVPATPILQILCVTGMLLPIHIINLDVLQAQGHGKLFFYLDVYKKLIGIFFLVLGSFFGLIGIATSRVASSFIALFVNCYFTGKHLRYGIKDQFNDMIDSIIFSFLTGLAIYTLNIIIEFSDWQLLLFAITVGPLIYLVFHLIFNKILIIDLLKLLHKKVV